jgi:hypothetical protein
MFTTVLLILLLFPLSLILINNKHDWGDDFSQYLDQARDFVNADFQSIDVVDAQGYAPPSRGEGFSLLLSPLLAFGATIQGYLLLVSISLMCLGMVLHRFFLERLPSGTPLLLSVLLVLVFVYNYQVLQLKTEILTVFPFMAVLYGSFILFQKTQMIYRVLLGILCGVTLSIALVGLSLYCVVVLHALYLWIRSEKQKNYLPFLSAISIPLLTYFSIQGIVLHKPTLEGLFWYKPIYVSADLSSSILKNIHLYYLSLTYFFEQEIWWWANLILKIVVPVLIVVGIVVRLRKQIRIEDLFLIAYLAALVCYPYQNSGIRFLLPLVPILLLYLMEGVMAISPVIRSSKFILSICFFTALLLSNWNNFLSLLHTSHSPSYGPQHKDAKEAFVYLKAHAESREIVGFAKPWALHYYSGNPGMPIEQNDSAAELSKKMAHYILLSTDPGNSEIYSAKLSKDINENTDYEKIWQNAGFALYEKNN